MDVRKVSKINYEKKKLNSHSTKHAQQTREIYKSNQLLLSESAKVPIKPRKPFFFFKSCERDKIILKNPNLSSQTMNKAIKENWQRQTSVEKEKYTQMAALDRARYEDEMKKLERHDTTKKPKFIRMEKTNINSDDMEKARKEYRLFYNSLQRALKTAT